MTLQGLEHIIYTLTTLRTKMMDKPDPMVMELIQESIVLCREDIAKKEEAKK